MNKKRALQCLRKHIIKDNVFKECHENQEVLIKNSFRLLVGELVWKCIESSFCSSYDYDGTIYITFMCENRYAFDVNKTIKEIFGSSFDDMGDNYTEYAINGQYILEMEGKK